MICLAISNLSRNYLRRRQSLINCTFPVVANGFDWGAPMDYFGEDEAVQAIIDAGDLINYAKSYVIK
ncbi:MAG: hypothetical protein QME63_04445 [Actinomycetota bacterium]|nr:hypothetical protein [Actinomycetota bacterium]